MNQRAIPLPAAQTMGYYKFWASLGAFWLLFQLYVWGRWVTGPYFVAVDPGPDAISSSMQTFFFLAQVICPILFLICIWFWVVVPWRREGRLTSDAMIVISGITLCFWDFSPSYVVDQVQYNSHMFNRGSWGLHAWPGWISPSGHRVAEPLFFVPPAYIVLVMSQVMLICWLLRNLKERRPDTRMSTFIVAIIGGLFLCDSLIETSILRTGLYAYPGAIHAITLFAGKTYQFPLSEGFLFGGLGLGAIGILKFFKDDKGRTFVERGIERTTIGETKKQWLRFLSIYGWIHMAFFVLYMLPSTLIAANTDPYPEGYPSYLLNDMCRYGTEGNQCPGPGISIPRPTSRL